MILCLHCKSFHSYIHLLVVFLGPSRLAKMVVSTAQITSFLVKEYGLRKLRQGHRYYESFLFPRR